MFFIGSTDHKGTYYWHSQQHNGWIVADLDHNRVWLFDSLAIVETVNNYCDAHDHLERKAS